MIAQFCAFPKTRTPDGGHIDRQLAREAAARIGDNIDRILKWALHVAADALSRRWLDVDLIAMLRNCRGARS